MAPDDRSDCLTEQDIRDLIDERLDAEAYRTAERHIEVCERCRDALDHAATDADDGRLGEWLTELDTHTPLFVTPRLSLPSGDGRRINLPPAGVPGYIGRIGCYLIKCELGRGAMGVVFLADDQGNDRHVAVKVPHPELTLVSDFLSRFHREARLVAAISHANVVRIYDAQTSADNFPAPYLVMEYVAGDSLKERVRSKEIAGAKIPPREAARYALQVAEGLAELHRHGVEHRDVKPSNILFGANGEAKIADFGLARGVESIDELLTRYGGIVGTSAYLAPERIKRPKDVSFAADQFSLGIALYEMLTGQRPFSSDDANSVGPLHNQILHHSPALPWSLNPKLPTDLETIILVCLEKDPKRRYNSMDALAADLRRFLNGEPILHRRPRRLATWGARNRVRIARVASVLLLIAVLGGVLVIQLSRHLQNAYIAQRIQQGLTSFPFNAAAKNAIETDLEKLDSLDPSQAGDWRVKYFDRLIQLNIELKQTRFEAGDSARLERCLRLVGERSPDRINQLREPVKVAWLREVIAQYARSESLYAFIAWDSDRIANLENFVRLEEQLSPGADPSNTKRALLRAYMARGDQLSHDPERAVRFARELLDKPVSPAWRMIVLRDYVWIGIQLREGNRGIVDDARRRIDEALDADPASYLPLLVERARVLASFDRVEGARADLSRYFDQVDTTRIRFRERRSADPALGESPPENVPAMFYFEACLLYGFLLQNASKPEDALQSWRKGYRAARTTFTGAYYEAAVLGSLCGEIAEDDADNMMVHTIETADPRGEDVAAQAVRFRTPAYTKVVAAILNRAWRSSRGRKEAEDIVFRRTTFRRFTSVQIRLWLFEGFKMGLAGWPAHDAKPSDKEEEFLWGLTEDLLEAFTTGGLSGRNVARTTALAFGPNPPPMLLRAGVLLSRDPNDAIKPGFAGWQQVSPELPAQLRSPIAFVLGRHYRLNYQDSADSRAFFQMAYESAAGSEWADVLRSLAMAELQKAATLQSP
jgi:serine/threonine protein kinase